MVSYQFEKHLSDNATFRQNGRAAHVEVNVHGLVRAGLRDHSGRSRHRAGQLPSASKATQLNHGQSV